MRTIQIYEEDAEALGRAATLAGVASFDLASMIFREHFATYEDEPRQPPPPIEVTLPPRTPTEARKPSGGPLVDHKTVAAHFGTTPNTILAWYHDGIIPAEVAESPVYRFDLDKVATGLLSRAERALDRVRDNEEYRRLWLEQVQLQLAELSAWHDEERATDRAVRRAGNQRVNAKKC